jgi:hypothetical protein
LLLAAAVVLLFGLSLVLLPEPMQAFFNLVMFGTTWYPPAFGTGAIPYITFLSGILGAVMAGWGVLLLYAVIGPLRHNPREGWTMIAVSLAAWFAVDTTFSLATGFWRNAVLNLGFAGLFGVPLLALRLRMKG